MTAASDFLALHKGQGFVLPNAWDPGSARLLEQVGFPALATTSAGIAFALGRPDGSLDRDTMIEHVARIVASVAAPVSADLEAGYGASPEDVARTVALVRDLGVVGANLEDQMGGELFEIDEAAARVAAARAAAPPGTFVLVPPGVAHGFRNDGTVPVRMFNIHAPAGFDRRIGLQA